MKDLKQRKDKLRLQINAKKKEYTIDQLDLMSEEVWSVLEITGVFQDAKKIFIYNGMADEVSTINFIKRWYDKKEFYLPVVKDNNLVFRKYDITSAFTESPYGILEPQGEDFTKYDLVDLVIVPGLAFDRKLNRIGRGKGYYDRFLSSLTKVAKVGVCFDFQLVDEVPVDKYDQSMDYIISENEIIWK